MDDLRMPVTTLPQPAFPLHNPGQLLKGVLDFVGTQAQVRSYRDGL